MTQLAFGSGLAFGVSSALNSSPQAFGALQGVSVDFSFGTKPLYGQLNFPITVARSSGKITGKISTATFKARQFNDLFFNNVLSAGSIKNVYLEAGSIPATPFQITVANAATFAQDLGVVYAATGIALTLVASAPATGQYSVSAGGVYTFAAADTLLAVLISYNYTVAGSGQVINIASTLMGVAPTFAIVVATQYQGAPGLLKLNACVGDKLSMATKLEDFTIPDFEFMAFADASNNIGTWSFADKAG